MPETSSKSAVVWPSRLGFYVFMTIVSILYFYPMLWLVLSSFRENRAIFQTPFHLPERINFHHWADAWEIGHIDRYALNSVIVTACTVVLVLLLASLASFAFSKLSFAGSRWMMALFSIGLFMPVQSFFIAQSYIFERLNLKDSYAALIIPYVGIGLPLAIFLLKAYLDSIPKELMEAARIDGCDNFVLFTRIIMPLLLPSLATVAIFTALNAWNELLLAVLYITSDDLKTIPVGLLAFSSRYVTDYKLLFSALSIVTIPMILVYVVFHRQVVSGLTEGSLK